MHKLNVITAFCLIVISSVLAAGPGSAGRAPIDLGVIGTGASQSGPEYDPTSILVRFKPQAKGADRAAARAMVAGGLRHAYHLVPGLEHVRIGAGRSVEAALETMRRLPFVEYAEPSYRVHAVETLPSDEWLNELWGLHNVGQDSLFWPIAGFPTGMSGADIGASTAWDTTTGTTDVIVAIIDTGIEYNHPDLDDNIWINAGEIAGDGIDNDGNGYVDDVRGWDFSYNDNDPFDGHFHGTHTAGTVGAEGNNVIGVAGVAWNVTLMPLKFLDDNGGGWDADAITALEYAVDNGARISNNSWGGGGYNQPLKEAIQAAGADGHLFVAAAGNDGSNNDGGTHHYPSDYALDNIISVAATDNNDAMATFSNWGVTSVDLGAPGDTILSTACGYFDIFNPFNWICDYGYASGTSMATPHVAGTAALVLGLNPGWTYAQVRDCLFDTVRPVGSLAGNTVTGGVVNAAAAVAVVQCQSDPTIPSVNTGDDQTSVEGTTVDIAASFTDSDDAGLHSATIDWGDGTLDSGGSVPVAQDTNTVSGSHVYADNGSYTVTVTVTDSNDKAGSDSHVVTVDNVAPSIITIVAPTVVDAGAPVTVTTTFSDPGAADSHDAVIDWGDASSTDEADVTSPYSNAEPHAYVVGSYTITVTVTDDDGGTGTAEHPITVASVPLPLFHVGDLDGTSEPIRGGTRWNATVTVKVVDANNNQAVSGASVNGSWSGGATGDVSCVTDGSGQCSVIKKNLKSDVASVIFTVTSVMHSDFVYDESANSDPDVDSSGTAIQVNKDGTTQPPGVQPLTADFNWSALGLDVMFTDTSTGGGTITSWSWDFGDTNGSSLLQNPPTYTYGESGTYTVILIVTDDEGASDSSSHAVTVTDGTGNSCALLYTDRKACNADAACTWSNKDKVCNTL